MARLRPPTPGTQIMLWAFPTLTLLYGLLYRFQSPERLSSPAFDRAQDVMSLHAWALVFIAVAAAKVICIGIGGIRAFVAMMLLGGALYAVWGGLFLLSAFTTTTAPFTGCLLPFGWAVAHLAMLATLVRSE